MRHRLRRVQLVVALGAVAVAFSAYWPVAAQAPIKRPLSYDVVDYWRTIQGTRLSNDGQWLAYSLVTQAEDPQLVVRNLKSGQEFHQPRGTEAIFTPDAKFL